MAKSIKFNGLTKHGKLTFAPGVPYGFEDPDAPVYFKGAGWAVDSKDEPIQTFTIAEIDIDPETLFGGGPNKGKKVLDVAAEMKG